MRKSIVTATAGLVMAGTAFMACGGKSDYELMRERVEQHGRAHAQMNCVQTQRLLRGQQGREVTEEDRLQIEKECIVRLRR